MRHFRCTGSVARTRSETPGTRDSTRSGPGLGTQGLGKAESRPSGLALPLVSKGEAGRLRATGSCADDRPLAGPEGRINESGLFRTPLCGDPSPQASAQREEDAFSRYVPKARAVPIVCSSESRVPSPESRPHGVPSPESPVPPVPGPESRPGQQASPCWK